MSEKVNISETEVTMPGLLATLLPVHGVKRVFVSPGSRNATIIEALCKADDLTVDVVVDERSAAFAALGYSLTSSEPVAIVCTSGTAPLNYSPAVAEAFYRKAPLIVITADRPSEWINQDDSQTLVQPGIYEQFAKLSIDIPVLKDEASVWFANRSVNEALIAATTGERGPVHLNIQIADRPVRVKAPAFLAERTVDVITPRTDMVVAYCRELAATIASPRKVMIIAGFLPPSSKLNRALSRIAEFQNVAILTETISNLHNPAFIGAIDLTLKNVPDGEIERYRPDVVITLGGALVSRRIKAFLRSYPPEEHWHVGLNERVIDIFRNLTRMVRMQPDIFFEQFAAALQPHREPSRYADDWRILQDKGASVLQSAVSRCGWSDLKAFATLIPLIPRRWNVHFSNGTPIRYAQLFGNHSYHRCECNRGVSGIDGCTSTAIGASLAYKDTTLLISGDMSALYDISAFASGIIPARFRLIVINNGGGGIFRFVNSTKQLAVRDKYLCGEFTLPLKNLCEGFGLQYFKADSEESLRAAFKDFSTEADLAAVMEIITPAELSAEILDSLLN